MVKTKRLSTEHELAAFYYLNNLRSSGEINMFGAGPYVQREFGIDKVEARSLVSLWMSNFNEEGDYIEIVG